MTRRGLVPALAVALAAFALYHATLLPDFDFGDTGSLQTTVGSPIITTRDAYPLYFALGTVILWLTRAAPAHALNLASALEAAIACGLFVLVAGELSGSIAAAAAAALLFAASYTFWSQAVIAEVYALHIAFVLLTLWLLLKWADRPTTARLTLFFAIFALGFGNHLAMVLLLPGYTAFLLLAAPRGWRSMFAPRVVAIALACACAGALQYTWNLRTLWLLPGPPHDLVDALQRFWFDVTKSDWRDTMVMHVPQSMLRDRLAMYWFDLEQQFGGVGPILALAGLVQMARADARRAILMAALFVVNVAFAFSYNVGDSHVFYLPSHLILALMAAPAIALAGRVNHRAVAVAAVVLAVYAGGRAYHDFPALDRSRDNRPNELIDALTTGLDDTHAILLADVNWQVANGLSYFAKVTRPEVVWARMPDVALYAPALVADNRAIGRDVALTEWSRSTLAAAYGPLLPTTLDPRVRVSRLADVAHSLAPGTRYVLCVLRPSPDLAIDLDDFGAVLRALTGGHLSSIPAGDYAAMAGTMGDAPELVTATARPFREQLTIAGVDVEIRMESWLVWDSIRRMGFGHVIAHRQHTLIVERGVSLVAFDDRGVATRTAYASNIFAPQARYLVDMQP